ncbi:MAG: DUF4912 domain-containing protein [Candidatus Sumerlaeia bacterium]|nr:DUF4912 domain-containing protein [Candidatus Sumerlaeia bacterium]
MGAPSSQAAPPKSRTRTVAAGPKKGTRKAAAAPVTEPVVEKKVGSEREAEAVVVHPHSTVVGATPHAAAVSASPVIAIRATKYEVTPPDRIIEPIYPEERVSELPREYGDTKLVLMVRDPEWLFFYWEIGKDVRQMLGLAPEGFIERLVVRLHDITGVEEFNGLNSLAWYEIPITGGAVSWYVNVPKTDCEWCAEIGVLNDQGEFIQICRSNTVRTPRNSIAESSAEDTEWMSVSEELKEILARSADVVLTGSSRIGSEAAIRQISRRLRLRLEQGEGASAPPSGSLAALRLGQRPGKKEAAEGVAPDLPLSVRTELIVSGSTDPSARVTIQGQPVMVRPDGTFSLRFELPDGEQVIPVRAVSSDAALTREVIPIVRRTMRP